MKFRLIFSLKLLLFYPCKKEIYGIKSRYYDFKYKNKDMIFVIGPKEKGDFAPFKKEDIERIKDVAKSRCCKSSSN